MDAAWSVLRDLGVAAVLLTALVALRRPRGGRIVNLIALAGIGLSLAIAWVTHEIPYDFKRFWRVGRDLARGVDYYALPADDPRDLILNPPTAPGLFRLWSVLPLPTAAAGWAVLNAVGVLLLVPLAMGASRSQDGDVRKSQPGGRALMLSAALALSCAHGMGRALGQVSLLAALAIVLALRAQGLSRPVRAGVWLAVATIKANTLAPFLLLFHRRKDLLTWIAVSLSTILLCAAGGPIADLPRRCLKTWEVIRLTHEPGRVNDYSYEGPSHASLIGLDHALHRLGLRNRGAIEAMRLAALGMLGGALGWAILSRRIDRPTACALVSLFAGVFLYHRIYDEIIVVLPLVFAARRADSTTGRARRLYLAAASACLLVLFVNPEGLLVVEAWARGAGVAGRIAQALVLPMATWLIALAAAALLAANATIMNQAPAPPARTGLRRPGRRAAAARRPAIRGAT